MWWFGIDQVHLFAGYITRAWVNAIHMDPHFTLVMPEVYGALFWRVGYFAEPCPFLPIICLVEHTVLALRRYRKRLIFQQCLW